MKTLYKYTSGLMLAGILSLGLGLTANAQHSHGGGGGGGGFHGSTGGGGFHSFGGSSLNSGSHFANAGHAVGGHVVAGGAFHGAIAYHRGGFYRGGFGYYGYPHLGFYFGVLPFGYYPFYWNDALYYYYGGVFYTPYDGGGYEVTTPPLGAAVPNIPEGARSIVINGQQFYELNGVYFKAVTNDQGKAVYEVAGRDGVLNTDGSNAAPQADVSTPQVGDIVNELPDNCRKVTLNGKRFFVSPNGIYYQSYTDAQGNAGYRIASVPDDYGQNDSNDHDN
jgi:hypothetical protein